MRKYIGILVFMGVLIAPLAHAADPLEGLFGLGDPNVQISYYSMDGTWRFYCWKKNCYDIATDKLAFVKDIEPVIYDLQQKVGELQDTVNQLQQPTLAQEATKPVAPTPTPTPTPIPTPEPVIKCNVSSNNSSGVIENLLVCKNTYAVPGEAVSITFTTNGESAIYMRGFRAGVDRGEYKLTDETTTLSIANTFQTLPVAKITDSASEVMHWGGTQAIATSLTVELNGQNIIVPITYGRIMADY